ncbi:hypothetical protein [Mesorhizobium sp. WSM2239]|uniref:HipA-like C-terminal domain-containing protein n=2 Tax=unclassified Mesorhizobium TaxID=325217 RepID=A0AAU8D4K8_9HYPH
MLLVAMIDVVYKDNHLRNFYLTPRRNYPLMVSNNTKLILKEKSQMRARPIFPVAFANVESDLFVGAVTERGDVVTAHRDGASHSMLLARLPDTAAEPLRQNMAALNAGVATMVEQANHARSEVHPARFPAHVQQLVVKYVSPAFQGLTQAGVDETRAADAAWKRATTPEPGIGTIRQEYRQLWRSLSLAERAARVENADLDELAAISEGWGFFPDLPQPVRDAIEARLVRLGTAKLHGLTGAFVKETSASEPLAAGPDAAQVKTAAEKLIDGYKQRREHLALVATTLRSVTIAIAAATELPIEVAYKLLMGRE